MKLHSESTTRNRDPILHVLEAVLPAEGTLLEIASGTGEHAAYFAPHFPGLTWIPTDLGATELASIAAWREEAGAPNLQPPRRLDTRDTDWGVGELAAILAINVIHYAPWPVTAALFRGAGRLLTPEGVLVTYGAYRIDGRHTAPSNETFDAWLRARDPESGVRDLAEVEREAERNGLILADRVAMPANNFTLVFRRS